MTTTPPFDESSHEAHFDTTDAYPPFETTDLLGATQLLARKVRILTEHLSVSKDQTDRIERQARRAKVLARAVLGVALLALVGVALAVVLLGRVQNAVDDNQHNAVTGCQNANQGRQGNALLWNFIIDTSLAQSTQTPASRNLLIELKAFIAELYQDHDCSDLSKKYPLPKAPGITNLS